MKAFTIAGLVASAAAFPGFNDMSKNEVENMLRERSDLDSRQLLGPVAGGLGSTITGLLGSVATEIDPANKRPEPGYTFVPPGKGDSRGPCPGLNLLANYGYLPRNGYVNYGQVVDATSRGFNMHPDLSTVLAVFAILTDGNITTESWWLGTDPSNSGNIGGLNRHDTVECDISPVREDFYLACGDNHHLSSARFYQMVEVAKSGSGFFDIATMREQYRRVSLSSQQNNPYLYYFPFPSIVSLGAFAFYPNFFSNGTYGAGGVANYESISSIIGAQYNKTSDTFTYVPEKWPSNWYRRATPYGAVTTLVDGFTKIYPANPVPMPIAQLGTKNFNVTTILCDLVEGLGSVTPLALAGSEEQLEAEIGWALSKLSSVGLNSTILGCPKGALSDQLYPNSTQKGGPLNPPPAVIQNAGNNVYNKTYFKTAPTSPQCSHVS